MTDLAKRAVACKHWKWMRGMLVSAHTGVNGFSWFTLVHVDLDFTRMCGGRGSEMVLEDMFGVLPLLDDTATLGCLLSLCAATYSETNKRRNTCVIQTSDGHLRYSKQENA